MNDQRQVIFNQRLKILKDKDISKLLDNFFDEIVSDLEKDKIDFQKSNDKKTYLAKIKNITGNAMNDEKLISLTSLNKEGFLKEIRNAYDLKKRERIKIVGVNENNDIEKKIFLQIIDYSWRAHLQYLEQLRQVIGLRSYGQKDPLSEFKKEAFVLFENLLEKIKIDIIKFLLNLNIVLTSENKDKQKLSTEEKNDTKKKKIQRNEKCPCGSGKKYKHCCGSI
tara:strand:- start:524 stop:1192 length:669 start_codon:yes stop_codon:yes gene_type:complete